jgi:antitoxin component of MazEF toxin-antitoxin module
MTTRIVRVGNTLMVEIPEEMVAQAGLQVGEPLEWVLNEDGSIDLVRQSDFTAKPRKRKTLEEILDGIPEGASLGEYDWGPARGVEVW